MVSRLRVAMALFGLGNEDLKQSLAKGRAQDATHWPSRLRVRIDKAHREHNESESWFGQSCDDQLKR